MDVHPIAPRNRVLRVTDDGRGMPRGRELEDSQTLGLTLVRALVKQFGGHLSIRGEHGTEVCVVFPPDHPELAVA